MSAIEGKLVRSANGVEGRVYAVALGEVSVGDSLAVGFIALVRQSDGTLTHIELDGAQLVEEPYVRPAPTALPGPGRAGS